MTAMPAPRRFTLSDYQRFGERHGFEYLWHDLEGDDDPCLAEGVMEEVTVAGGLTLVISDVLNHRRYGARSLMAPGFTSILLLEGHAEARLGGRAKRLTLNDNDAITVSHGDSEAMSGEHQAGLRLRSVSLLARESTLSNQAAPAPLRQRLARGGFSLNGWRADGHLRVLAESLFQPRWDGGLGRLWQEGVALQILAQALSVGDDATPPPARLSERDRRALARVREALHQQPEHDHTLDALARLACMSSSTLRRKFRCAYGQSVFDYLRDRRLERASHGLRREGWSVEQAAERAGYRHANNFAAAFKRRFGMVPSRWR
ncbi:helix-turn-helix transcriptional regulator [Alloalcanivorax sp. C16-2]|uniref:helix-turn-helix transcriptional regulator n=1 Tax=Alloalcanivorax sp. C16-2 TaxID=3390052 RepID=UPI003970742A